MVVSKLRVCWVLGIFVLSMSLGGYEARGASFYDKSVHIYIYNNDHKLETSVADFNNFQRRGKNSILVLEGAFDAVLRSANLNQMNKYDYHDSAANSALVATNTFHDPLYDNKPTGIPLPGLKSNDEINKIKNRVILELPAGLYIIKVRDTKTISEGIYFDAGSTKFTPTGTEFRPAGWKNKSTKFVHGFKYYTVRLQAGKFLFFNGEGNFSSNKDAVVGIGKGMMEFVVFGLPGRNHLTLPIEAIIRGKDPKDSYSYMSPYAVLYIASFPKETKLGIHYKPLVGDPGQGLLVTYVDTSKNAWYSGIRAGDIITAVKGYENMSPAQAMAHVELGSKVVVKRFRDGQVRSYKIIKSLWS